MTRSHDLTGVACQLGDCGNPAALTVTVELPTSWTEEREYTTRTLQVAVCGECAPTLEADSGALLEARVRCGRRLDVADAAARLHAQLVALIEAVGPPYEPVDGSVFARWLAELDQPGAQGAWRLLAHMKRTREASPPPDPPRPSQQPPRSADAGVRRPVLVRPDPAPGGGDDAA
jgi:hypothetical protein